MIRINFGYKNVFILFLIALFFIAIPSIAIAGDIYVDAEHGSDATGDGSEANPYATIQKAVDEAVNDDVILVDTVNDYLLPNYYDGITVNGKSIVIKKWEISIYDIIIYGASGADGNPPVDGEAGVTATNGARVYMTGVEARGGNGGNATGVIIDGAKGGPGISAEGDGTTVQKTNCKATGGEGGSGSNGGGEGGAGGEGEQADGGHIRNLFDSPAIGGGGGDGGQNMAGPGGNGGNGGIGAKAMNNGLIEYVSTSIPSGGIGGIGGTGQPDGSPGPIGLATFADSTSQVLMFQDIPTLSEWGMLIMGLLLLAVGTVAVVRRKKASPLYHEK